jgi:hypothetical protein
MAKIYLKVGKTDSESIDSSQPVWVLVPGTKIPAVVSTYARQLYPGARVLMSFGSVRNLFNNHLLPHLDATSDRPIEAKRNELATVIGQIDTLAGDAVKRSQIFLNFLSTLHLVDRKLYPLRDKLRRNAVLSGKDIEPLIDALYTALRKNANATAAHKQKLRDYIQNGSHDEALILWLARFVDPVLALHLRHDSLVAELVGAAESEPPQDNAALALEFRSAMEQIRAGQGCADRVCGIDLRQWLSELVGCEPQPRFFAEVGTVQSGQNRSSCLNVDRSKSFQDFGENAPRYLTIDKLSRCITALDRTLSHLAITFANEDSEMKELCRDYAVHSGLLIRGMLDESEAIRTLYPLQAMAIPRQPELTDTLIGKIRAALASGDLARVCAPTLGIDEDELNIGIEKAVDLQRQLLPLVPIEVHRLADAIETRIRLQKIADKLTAAGKRPQDQQQAVNLNLAIRAQAMRQNQLSKMLKTDFRIDPPRLFYLDELLIDRIKALFGNELEFIRGILIEYLERQKAAQEETTAADDDSGSAVNG